MTDELAGVRLDPHDDGVVEPAPHSRPTDARGCRHLSKNDHPDGLGRLNLVHVQSPGGPGQRHR
ncbi:MAG: hypothetical protein ACRDOJ_05005, partial [Nocardioidaceae bacterium]